MSLVVYSSSSDSENDEINDKNPKRIKLPLPSVDIQLPNEIDLFEKDAAIAGVKNTDANGRIRLFPHERGNWALSIFAFVQCSSHLDTMIDDLIEIVNVNASEHWIRLVELHVSLSKTFPVRFHHIESIRTALKQELSLSMLRFSARIDSVEILTNDDGSTSFLVLTLDQQHYFAKLITIVDKILGEYRYPTYYENPCFHVSFAYSTEQNREELLPKDWKDKCKTILKQYQCQPSALTIRIDDIRLKAGKRIYQLTS